MAFGLGGENVGRAFVSLHANGDDVPDDIGDALDKMTPKFQKAGAEHAKAYSDWFARESKKNSRKSADEFLGGFRDELHLRLKDFEKTKGAAEQLAQGIKRLKIIAKESDLTTSAWLDRFHRKLGIANDDGRIANNWLDRFHGRLGAVNKSLDESATRVGKMFGKGSRNDFLNLLGASIEGLSRMIALAPKAAEKLSGIFTGKGGSGGGMDLAKIATQVGTSIVGIVVGLVGLITVAGAASTLISGIAAALIGLVGSATFAAGAVGGVALALTGPLVAAVGVGLLAIQNLDQKTKDAFAGIGDSFSKLGDSAGKAIGPGLREAARLLKPEIGELKPLIDGVAESLGNVASGWAKALNTPDYIILRERLEKFIPGAVEQLGVIFGNVFSGIGGIMVAAIPTAQRFLDWVTDITDQFGEWANSPIGRGQLAEFFDEAADSAKAVGEFLADAVVAVADLLAAGKDSGDSLFRKMADQLERFSNYLTDPENQAAIRDFFANGVDVAEKLGDAILDIADALDKLDTPESRAFLGILFTTFTRILQAVVLLSTAFTKSQKIIGRWANDAVDRVQAVKAGFDRLRTGIANVLNKIGPLARDAFERVKARGIDAVQAVISWFGRLPARIMGFLSPIPGRAGAIFTRISQRAGEVVGNIADFFGRLPGRVGSAISGLAGRIYEPFQNAASRVADIPGRIVSLFSGLAGRILSAIGTIDVGSLIKIPDGISIGGHNIPLTATGGVFGKVTTGPQLRWVGEEGPEAIVPLNRPLGQIDPSVRGLSAIAQGLATQKPRTIDASGWTIVTQGPNPYAVAREVVNDFAAKALF